MLVSAQLTLGEDISNWEFELKLNVYWTELMLVEEEEEDERKPEQPRKMDKHGLMSGKVDEKNLGKSRNSISCLYTCY